MTQATYPTEIALEVQRLHPELPADDIAAVLMADPTLTADEVIATLDEAAAEHAANLAADA